LTLFGGALVALVAAEAALPIFHRPSRGARADLTFQFLL